MESYNAGKDFVCGWVRERFPIDATILDVGACDGKWKELLPEYACDNDHKELIAVFGRKERGADG